MSTSQAQIIANHLNAQHSTGPRSAEGKAVVARNNFRHGCAGAIFIVLDWEKQEEFDELVAGLREEHAPATPTEHLLVDKMAQSYWLSKRASYLQHMCFDSQVPMCSATEEKVFALYMRYQTTHERAFYKALNELQKLRAEKRKSEIGFESQQRQHAQEERREAVEKRQQELHEPAVLLAQAKLERQLLLNMECANWDSSKSKLFDRLRVAEKAA